MHRRGQFGSVAAYLIRSFLVYVWCTVRNQTGSDSEQCKSNKSNFSKIEQWAPWWWWLHRNMLALF